MFLLQLFHLAVVLISELLVALLPAPRQAGRQAEQHPLVLHKLVAVFYM